MCYHDKSRILLVSISEISNLDEQAVCVLPRKEDRFSHDKAHSFFNFEAGHLLFSFNVQIH